MNNVVESYKVYNNRMTKAIMDKLFFVDKIDPELLVDFGCADGTLLQHLSLWYPNAELIGFDISDEMISLATNNNNKENIHFTNDWSLVRERVSSFDGKTAIVLSSVIHEIYHYSTPSEITEFWKQIFESGFDYIVVRDMLPSRSVDRPADINDVAKVYRKFLNSKALRDFEEIWGTIETNRNLIHFLLKYRYVEPNWEREVKENYIPLSREELLHRLPLSYDIMYHEHYVLPFIKREVMKDLRIDIKDPTHLKLILENQKD